MSSETADPPAASMTWDDFYGGVAAWVSELAGRIARRYGVEHADAEQTLLLRLWQSFSRYDPARSRPTTWTAWQARGVAGRLEADRSRAKRKCDRLVSLDHPDMLDQADRHTPDPAAVAESRDMGSPVAAAVDRLPERQRLVLRARFGLDGRPVRTLRELARVLGVTQQAVRQTEVTALATLAETLGVPMSDRVRRAVMSRKKAGAAATT